MINNIGKISNTQWVEEYVVNKYPKYTATFSGTEAQCRTSGSAYFAKGWDVTLSSGNPWNLVCKLENEKGGSDGITPVTASVLPTKNWSLHYKTTEKDLLHTTIQQVSWINQVTNNQITILETCFSTPPEGGNILTAYPTFNNLATGSAGETVWNMHLMGFKSIPIVQAILRLSMEVNSNYVLTDFTANVNRYYTKTSLATAIGIPTNFKDAMPQDTDPASGTTHGITCYYGWLKQPPTIDQDGSNIKMQQEWEYGLWPSNIYGVRL